MTVDAFIERFIHDTHHQARLLAELNPYDNRLRCIVDATTNTNDVLSFVRAQLADGPMSYIQLIKNVRMEFDMRLGTAKDACDRLVGTYIVKKFVPVTNDFDLRETQVELIK